MTPHSKPSTTIGLPTAERIPFFRTTSGMSCAAGVVCVEPRRLMRLVNPIDHETGVERDAGADSCCSGPLVAAIDGHRPVVVEPEDHGPVGAQAACTSSHDRREDRRRSVPRATSVATRRRAACSSASRSSSSRDSVFATAVATSSVNAASLSSEPAGRLRSLRRDEHGAPQSILDDDRGCDRDAPAVAARDLGRLTRASSYRRPGRLSRLHHDRQDVVAADRRRVPMARLYPDALQLPIAVAAPSPS